MNLEPKPGFDLGRVTWGRPDSVVSALCSYCSASIGKDDMPLRMWRADGHAAQFCDACQRRWWGLETFDAACKGCGASQPYGKIRCDKCGAPLVFPL